MKRIPHDSHLLEKQQNPVKKCRRRSRQARKSQRVHGLCRVIQPKNFGTSGDREKREMFWKFRNSISRIDAVGFVTGIRDAAPLTTLPVRG